MLTAVLAALVIPLSVVFVQPGHPIAVLVSLLVAVVFVADIVIRFNTAYQTQGRTITDRRVVARRYSTTWLWVDVAAALPVGIVLRIAGIPGESLIHLLSFVVLLKLLRVNRTLGRVAGPGVNPAILRLFLLGFWVMMAAHLIACGWMLILGNPEDLMPIARYIRAFYWTITTLTTIGYGDITPSGSAQTVFVILVEILGAGIYGLVIGSIASLVANIDVAKAQHREKVDRVNAFLRYKAIPAELQGKVNGYYGYLWETRRGYDEQVVLEDLPEPLKVSVSLHINKEMIERVPIFEQASEELIKDIIMNLTPVVFCPGDSVVTVGEVGFDMYFISKGRVDVVSADESTVYATLNAGDFFGEIALLLSTPRTATIRTREYCDLYRLDKQTFERVVGRYPKFAGKMKDLAEKRREELQRSMNGEE